MASSSPRPDPPFLSALLLTDHEDNVFTDRNALRSAGVKQFHVLTSGLEAALHLSEKVSTVIYPVTELVVCLPHLADMTQVEFANLIRSHPLLPHIPLMAICAQRDEEKALKNAGFNIVLQRPFALNALESALHTMAEQAKRSRAHLIATLKQSGSIPPVKVFHENLDRYRPPDKDTMSAEACYRHGKDLLLAQRRSEALPYLQKAASSPDLKGEACLALAMLWRERRDMEQVTACLHAALQAFVDTESWGRVLPLIKYLTANTASAAMPEDTATKNQHPLLHELERLLRQSKFDKAAHLTPILRPLVPDNDIRQTLIRGCHATQNPQESMAAMRSNLLRTDLPEDIALALTAPFQTSAPDAKKTWFHRILSRKEESGQDKTEGPLPKPAEVFPPPLFTHAHDENLEERSKQRVELREIPTAAKPSAQATTPLHQEESPHLEPLGEDDIVMGNNSLRPSWLGDAWTMVKGTARLYHSSKRPPK